MNETFFKTVIKNHPDKTVALYKGATVNGIFLVSSEKVFNDVASFYLNTSYTFTCLTSELPSVTQQLTIPITIDDKEYSIKKVVPETRFTTVLDLE
jgi:hypothetical protein